MSTKHINALDLAFVVDTTNSMSGLIADAKQHMVAMVQGLLHAAPVLLRLGIVEYRDHPPQDTTFVYRIHPFTDDMQQAQDTINELAVYGGGDGPESVLDGVLATCKKLQWRSHARRLAVLIGDAPPHGVGAAGDGFPRGCPCGETVSSVTAALEAAGITVYAIGMNNTVVSSFGDISHATGGEFFLTARTDGAIERLQSILRREFGNLDFDRRVLEAWKAQSIPSIELLAGALGSSRPAVSAAISRLGARELL